MVTYRQEEGATDQKRGEDGGVERNVMRDRMRGRGRENERKREFGPSDDFFAFQRHLSFI